MQAFVRHTGIAAPLLRPNIDTDAIIPSREMKQVSKRGLDVGLFAAWGLGGGAGGGGCGGARGGGAGFRFLAAAGERQEEQGGNGGEQDAS